MPYPLGIDTKTVVGHYAEIYYDKILGQYLQRPKNAFVYVYPAVTEVLIDNTILDLSELSPQRIPVDTNGNFSVEVITTDQNGLEPNNGWTYRFKPSWNESDSFISPVSSLTSPIEMSDYFNAKPVEGVITTRGNDGRGIITITADGTIATVHYTDTTTSTFDLPVGEGGSGGTATPDATSTTKGKLKLTNDLAGTADLPQVSSAIKASLAKADSAVQPAGLTKAAVGLANVDNTSDLNKPVSNATQAALNNKVNISNLHTVATTGNYNDLSNKPTIPSTKADVGLGNVDNTSDLNKPISAATQAALDSKQPTGDYVLSVNDQMPDENGNVVIATDVGSVDWTTITNKPTSFTPSAHSHVKADITDLTLPQYPNNSGTATIVPRPQTFNVRDYGALGDGSTNDTAAINACIAAAPVGSRIFFPVGTYIVSPDATKHMLRIDKKNLEIFGENYNATIIKVADGAGDFISMITNRNPAGAELDTSGIFIHDLTFDQNVANNPVTNVALLMSTNYRFSIRCTSNVQNGRVERVRFINSDCVINLVVTDGHNWQVRDCFFDNIGPGADHDHSTVNIRGNNAHVTGCTFVGTGNAAWSAIEIHGDGHRVLFNNITNYARMIITCGAIVSGRDSIIAYNTGKGLGAGIHIWSYDFASLVGPSVEHLIVVNNQIEIDYDRWSSVFNNVRTGIELQPGSTSVIRDIKINNNQITYAPFSGTPTTSDNRSAGILLYRGGDIVTEGTSDEDIDISNNQIT